MIGFVALHYPTEAEHGAFVARVEHAVAVIGETPGCLGAECWLTPEGDAVVSVGRWESEEAQTASLATATAAGVDFAYDEREARPRKVIRLVSPR